MIKKFILGGIFKPHLPYFNFFFLQKIYKPLGERQTPYDLTYKRNLMKKIQKTNEKKRTRSIKLGYRLTFVRGGGGAGGRD